MASIGIDLGTTNSLIAVFSDDKPRLFRNALGSVLTPSAVSLSDDGTLLVGQAARERLLTHPGASASSFKRLMGTAQTTRLGKKTYSPEELSAFVLMSLKADAEADLGEPVTEAVISVPAYFNDPQRRATIDAARLAGLSVTRLVNEPTAAALAYGLGERGEGKFLIFDLGGGTFDVSILDRYEDIMEIRATTGDTRLGGDDFDRVILDLLCTRHALNYAGMRANEQARLLRTAEGLKVSLSSHPSSDYTIDPTENGTLTRADFEKASAPLLQRLRLPTERAVRDAGMKPGDFDAVVLVGGSTRMPMVRSLVARLFGRLPLASIDPDTAVALGAAIQAGLVARHGVLRDVVMTDVCPHTLGVATIDDPDVSMQQFIVSPVIERNAVVPISRTITVSTVQNRQKRLEVQVYQGENLRPSANVFLGSIEVAVPSGPRGKESVEIRFTYDISGALQVEAKVVSTQRVYEKVFRNTAGISDEDMAKRFAGLASIKLHPREQQENQALIARAERLYEEQRGETREELRELIMSFEREIASQQLRNPENVRMWFAEALEPFDRSPFGKA